MTLYEINKEIAELLESAFDPETGLINDESTDLLEQLSANLQDKIIDYGLVIKNKMTLANAIREEEKNLAKRRKSLENQIDTLKGIIAPHIVANGKIENEKIRLSTRKSESIDIIDEGAIPFRYKIEQISYKVDKNEIKKSIKDGDSIPGAQLVENHNLQIK